MNCFPIVYLLFWSKEAMVGFPSSLFGIFRVVMEQILL